MSDADAAAQVIQQTRFNNRLDAVYEKDTHTLWFDTNDNGTLDSDDLHMMLNGVTHLGYADIMVDHVIG